MKEETLISNIKKANIEQPNFVNKIIYLRPGFDEKKPYQMVSVSDDRPLLAAEKNSPPERLTEEKRVEAYLVKNSIENNGKMICLNSILKKMNLHFLICELALLPEVSKLNKKIIFDILALNENQGEYEIVLIEIKYDRLLTELKKQLEQRKEAVLNNIKFFEDIASAMINKKIKLSQKIIKMIIWPEAKGNKTRVEGIEDNFIIISYSIFKDKINFDIEKNSLIDKKIENKMEIIKKNYCQPFVKNEIPINIDFFKKKIIISDYDRDGIFSSVILLRYFKNYNPSNFDVWYMRPDKLNSFFKHPHIRDTKSFDLFICDLPLPIQNKTKIINSIKEFSKGNIYWFDHHLWTDENLNEIKDVLKERFYHNPKEKTAVKMLIDYFSIDEEYTKKLMDLVYYKLNKDEMQLWGQKVLDFVDGLARGSVFQFFDKLVPLINNRIDDLDEACIKIGKEIRELSIDYANSREFNKYHFGEAIVVEVPIISKRILNYIEISKQATIKTKADISITYFEKLNIILIANKIQSDKYNLEEFRKILTEKYENIKSTPTHKRLILLKAKNDIKETVKIIISELKEFLIYYEK